MPRARIPSVSRTYSSFETLENQPFWYPKVPSSTVTRTRTSGNSILFFIFLRKSPTWCTNFCKAYAKKILTRKQLTKKGSQLASFIYWSTASSTGSRLLAKNIFPDKRRSSISCSLIWKTEVISLFSAESRLTWASLNSR